MDEAIASLVELVKTTAPELWRIAVRQVYAEAWINVFWIVVGLLVIALTIWFSPRSFALVSKYKHQYYQAESDSPEETEAEVKGILTQAFGWIILPCLAVLSMIMTINNVTTVIGNFVNPEFYAIQVLINLVK